MPYLDDVTRQLRMNPPVGADLGIPKGMAYSSYYPDYEIQTPQYPVPNPYALMQMGYRANSLIYALINIRKMAISEGHIRIMDNTAETPEEITKHKLLTLMKRPVPGFSEQEFWDAVETYLCIAGFSAWEKERNNRGEVINLWPMCPEWCSFMRGEQKPVRAIRYQPYGLPPADIAIENVVLFQYFDPWRPQIAGLGPTQAALNIIGIDNDATKLVSSFLKNGGFLSGLLKTEQSLQEAEAERIKTRWRNTKGGSDNAGDIAVLGAGTEFQPLTQTFGEMVFPELDARSEARICATFNVPPIMAITKLGMDRSTYSNYTEARKAMYEGIISHEWNYLSSQLTEQLLPDFDGKNGENYCQFDTRGVKALQEDRTAKWTRAVSAAQANIVSRDEAREEMELDPVDDDVVWVGNAPTMRVQLTPQEAAQIEGFSKQTQDEMAQEGTIQAPSKTEQVAIDTEKKAFRKFAKQRTKEGKAYLIKEFEFKFVPGAVQAELLAEFQPEDSIRLLAQSIERAVEGMTK